MINKNRYSTTNNNFELAKSLFLIKIIKKKYFYSNLNVSCLLLIIWKWWLRKRRSNYSPQITKTDDDMLYMFI
jgi:hypothetical protein